MGESVFVLVQKGSDYSQEIVLLILNKLEQFKLEIYQVMCWGRHLHETR